MTDIPVKVVKETHVRHLSEPAQAVLDGYEELFGTLVASQIRELAIVTRLHGPTTPWVVAKDIERAAESIVGKS
ncbi:MAG TPA: hypothetical protein VIG47_14000 [Gemmatimonadaceae bacterium]|jgi:hypothetical protein